MKVELFKSLDEIQKLVRYYITLYATWLLVLASLDLRKANQSQFSLLNVLIETHWSSLVFGVCFFFFIFILYLRINNLKLIIQELNHHNAWDQEDINKIKSPNWLLSPLSESKLGPVAFFAVIFVGFIHLNLITCGHLFASGYSHPFQLIGWIDLFFLVASLLLISSVVKTLCQMRGAPPWRRILITVFSIQIVVTLFLFIYYFVSFQIVSQQEQDSAKAVLSNFQSGCAIANHYDGERIFGVRPTCWHKLTFKSKEKLMKSVGLLCQIKNRGRVYVEVKDGKTNKTIAIYSKRHGLTVY